MSTILLIEDDPWLNDLYAQILADQPHCSVKTAQTAVSALGVLEDSKIDLILLDMFLPDHSGIEFLHEIMSYTDTNQTPIIILSSVFPHDIKLSEERWNHYGVKQYLYKPKTKPNDLIVAVKKQLAKAQS